MSDNVLVVLGVRRTFQAENAPVRAVRGVDLSLARGEFVAVLGPSGCGKSRGVNGAAAEA
jgi:putative ABC transport system ATP-binding protein